MALELLQCLMRVQEVVVALVQLEMRGHQQQAATEVTAPRLLFLEFLPLMLVGVVVPRITAVQAVQAVQAVGVMLDLLLLLPLLVLPELLTQEVAVAVAVVDQEVFKQAALAAQAS